MYHISLISLVYISPLSLMEVLLSFQAPKQDLMALLSVAFQQQQDLIQQQRGRMDRLLLEFADLRQELEEDGPGMAWR